MKNQLAGLMKQAQMMQRSMEKMQKELDNIFVEGEAGAGIVKIRMNCKHAVSMVSIDPSLMEDDKEMLEDLLTAAFNDGLRKAEMTAQEKMASVTGGFSMPQGMKMPF